MTNIKNLSQENLKQIASDVNGKLWIKGDKIRIYVSGGNNYHYDGKWYFEIAADGSWESKVYLSEGYNNDRRAEYVEKHLKSMKDDMEGALSGEQVEGGTAIIIEEYLGVAANLGNNDYKYPTNFYNGCGSYYLAFDQTGKIIASVNFTSSMERNESKQLSFFEKQIESLNPVKIIAADGSGCTFFARKESDIDGLPIEKKIYTVPKAGGGRHKNIELILEKELIVS